MPPRFFSSPFKNATATPAKRDAWWSEIPVVSAAPSDTADAIKCCSDYWLAIGSASGSLVVLPFDHQGKQGSKAPTIQTGVQNITAFDVDSFDDLVAVGGEHGQINVFRLPTPSEVNPATSNTITPPHLCSTSVPNAKPIDVLAFHPLASSVFLASSQSMIYVFDAAGQDTAAIYTLESPSPSWSVQWSRDGQSITATGKDGKLRLWDVRSGKSEPTIETACHGGTKASRHVHLGPLSAGAGPQILTTGFSRTRDREYCLYDLASLGNGPTQTQRVDTGTGILVPLLDESRGIVYLAGKGDMTLRWTEISPRGVLTEGAAQLPVPIASAALAPPPVLHLMEAEINRLVVLGGGGADAVLPVSVHVPRRQYLDFHSDLYPPVSARQPAQDSAAWRQGDDSALLEKRQLDPNVRWPARGTAQPAADRPASAPPAPSTSVPESSSAPSAPTAGSEAPSSASAAANETTEALQASSIEEKALETSAQTGTSRAAPVASEPAAAKTPAEEPKPAPVAAPQTTAAKADPTRKPAAPGAPFNPGWSRNFLAGKTPLKPDYYDVHDVSSTMGNDVQLLQATTSYFFFPLGGPGGRLAFHALSSKGRLPVHPSCISIGGTITQFSVDPFDPARVLVAGDDGAVRVFELPSEAPEEGTTYSEPARVLSDGSMDRVVDIRPHPTAENLVATLSEDRGHPTARFWNVATGDLLKTVDLPKGGISSVAWSPDGELLALATKDKQVHVFNPRDVSSTIRTTGSHESIRPVRLAWAADRRLLSTGFTRGASRELILYSVDGDRIAQLGKVSLDISPSALFPFVDLDTRIALLYSRGDRSCLAFELDLDPETPQKAFTKLPAFEHGSLQIGYSFLPKTRNDVKAVEIVKALRLTQKEVEVVSFTVPRAKADYFQDDIFVPTRDVEKPTMDAQDWLNGKNAPPELIDLRPEGMKPLSEAPPPPKVVSTRSQVRQDGMTDSQRGDAQLDELFENAKAGAGSDEEDEAEPVRSKHAIVDDDDW